MFSPVSQRETSGKEKCGGEDKDSTDLLSD